MGRFTRITIISLFAGGLIAVAIGGDVMLNEGKNINMLLGSQTTEVVAEPAKVQPKPEATVVAEPRTRLALETPMLVLLSGIGLLGLSFMLARAADLVELQS